MARRWLAPVFALAATFALTGCRLYVTAEPSTGASTPPAPAESAGGACYLLNYDVVRDTTGISFNIAATGRNGRSQTCVLQSSTRSLPDLTLAVSPTVADPVSFTKVIPAGGDPVEKLGKLAYRATFPPGTAGPELEVGWLAGNNRLLTLRYRFPVGTADADVNVFADKLVTLAKRVDLYSV